MKFGVSISPAKLLTQEIERIGKWGADFVEIYTEPPLDTPEMISKKAPLIKKLLKAHDLSVIGHGNFACVLGSPDLTERASWLLELKREIAAVAKIGAHRMDIHANLNDMLGPAFKAVEMDNLIDSFAVLSETAKEHNIALNVENTRESVSDIEHLISKVKGLHATLDIGHAFMRGGMSEVKKFLDLKAVNHMHVHDVKGLMDHYPIGEGKINFKEFAEILRKRKYDETVLIEVISSDENRRKSFEKFRELMK
jgi:sugar phosphate isomerase/epimerase